MRLFTLSKHYQKESVSTVWDITGVKSRKTLIKKRTIGDKTKHRISKPGHDKYDQRLCQSLSEE